MVRNWMIGVVVDIVVADAVEVGDLVTIHRVDYGSVNLISIRHLYKVER